MDRCVICNSNNDIQEHHLNILNRDDSLTRPVCRRCHMRFHSIFDEYINSYTEQIKYSNGYYSAYIFFLVKKTFKFHNLDPMEKSHWNCVKYFLEERDLIKATNINEDFGE